MDKLKDQYECEKCKTRHPIDNINISEDGEVYICLDCFDNIMNGIVKID